MKKIQFMLVVGSSSSRRRTKAPAGLLGCHRRLLCSQSPMPPHFHSLHPVCLGRLGVFTSATCTRRETRWPGAPPCGAYVQPLGWRLLVAAAAARHIAMAELVGPCLVLESHEHRQAVCDSAKELNGVEIDWGAFCRGPWIGRQASIRPYHYKVGVVLFISGKSGER